MSQHHEGFQHHAELIYDVPEVSLSNLTERKQQLENLKTEHYFNVNHSQYHFSSKPLPESTKALAVHIQQLEEAIFKCEILDPLTKNLDNIQLNELNQVIRKIVALRSDIDLHYPAHRVQFHYEMSLVFDKIPFDLLQKIVTDTADDSVKKELLSLMQQYAPQRMDTLERKEKGSLLFADEIQARKTENHVKEMVANALLRFRNSKEYSPVSELVAHISALPIRDSIRLNVFNRMLDQFSAFASDGNLASISRMLDVVEGILRHDSKLRDDSKDEVNLPNFLKKVLDSNVTLDNAQKDALLHLLSFSNENKNKSDITNYSKYFALIEAKVGPHKISEFLNNVHSKSRQEDSFLNNLKKRLDLYINSAADDKSKMFNAVKKFRQNQDEFLSIKNTASGLDSPRELLENLVYLHQYDATDFNDACLQFSKMYKDSLIPFATTKFDLLFKTMVRQINHLEPLPDGLKAKDYYAMMHDFFRIIAHDYQHPQALVNFFKLAAKHGFSNHDVDSLFRDPYFFKFITHPSNENSQALTNFQRLLLNQFQNAFYGGKKSHDFFSDNTLLFSLNSAAISSKSLVDFIQSTIGSLDDKHPGVGFNMIAQLLTQHTKTESRIHASQFIQFVLHHIFKSAPKGQSFELIDKVFTYVGGPEKEMLCAEIAHYFKGGRTSNASINELKTQINQWTIDTTTSYSGDGHDDTLLDLVQQINNNFESLQTAKSMLETLGFKKTAHNVWVPEESFATKELNLDYLNALKNKIKDKQLKEIVNSIDFDKWQSIPEEEKRMMLNPLVFYWKHYSNNVELLLPHLIAGLPQHIRFNGAAPIMGLSVSNQHLLKTFHKMLDPKKLPDGSRQHLLQKCESLISAPDLPRLKTLVAHSAQHDEPHLKSFVNDLTLTGGKQMSMRSKLVNARKVQKIKSANNSHDIYFWMDILREYAKYARLFEVDRTKTLSVSHIGSSLSV